MFDTFRNRLEIEGKLTTITALRISKGRSTEPIGSDLPVIKDALGKPLIPGSSFKGALRSRLESFLRGIVGTDRKLVANPANQDEWSLTAKEISNLKQLDFDQLITFLQAEEQENLLNLEFDELKKQLENLRKNISEQEFDALKNEQKNYDSAYTTIIEQQTDLISHLFGSPWVASKFQVRDLTVIPDTWFGQYQERDGVSIDRDTETAADGKLYDFQVVPAGTQFQFKTVVENAEEWELGLLMVGLHQFETEQIPLGGGISRGLGVVKLEIDQMQWVKPENPQQLRDYIKNLVENQLEDYQITQDRQLELKQKWTKSFINQLTQYLPTSSETSTV